MGFNSGFKGLMCHSTTPVKPERLFDALGPMMLTTA